VLGVAHLRSLQHLGRRAFADPAWSDRGGLPGKVPTASGRVTTCLSEARAWDGPPAPATTSDSVRLVGDPRVAWNRRLFRRALTRPHPDRAGADRSAANRYIFERDRS